MTLLLLLCSIFLLSGCGTNEPLASPAPPPLPAPHFARAQADKDVVTGVLSELHVPTRTWLLIREGGGHIVCFLDDKGVVEVDGATKLLTDLPDGATVTAEGKLDGDLLVTRRVALSTGAPTAPVLPEGAASEGGTATGTTAGTTAATAGDGTPAAGSEAATSAPASPGAAAPTGSPPP